MNPLRRTYLTFLLLAPLALSWTTTHHSFHQRTRHRRIHPLRQSATDAAATRIVQLDGDEDSLRRASRFMIDSFWLGDERMQVSSGTLTARDVDFLLSQQLADFTKTYGETMGSRMLDKAILAAVDAEGSINGIVTLQMVLLDHTTQQILNAPSSEELLRDAVASLGPKQRREYKDASAIEIANELLPSSQQLVSCLCNLAVAPDSRRQGIAERLCLEAEALTRMGGFEDIFLSVEAENAPACRLYGQKLGYDIVYEIASAPALRVDLSDASFVETTADSFLMRKLIL